MIARLLAKLRDLLADVGVEMHARRARTVLLMIGIGLSTGTLISAVTISTTAAHQVDAGLAASTLDLISVTAASGATSAEITSAADNLNVAFPADAEARVRQVDLVVDGGRRVDITGSVTTGRDGRSASPPRDRDEPLTVLGLTSGYLTADSVTAPTGWMLDGERPVALLGVGAAKELDIPVTADPTGLSVTLNGSRYDIVGYLRGGATGLTDAIAIPYQRALPIAGSDGETTMLIRTEMGAGATVAGVIRQAIRPEAPQRLSSSQVLDIKDLRTGVSTELDRLAAWVGALLLVLTVLLIANAMTVSVMGRTSEIGLRRAMGASRRSVAGLFLAEGGVAGALGGLAGSAFAAFAVLIVCLVNDWTAILPPATIALGPVVGMVAGLVSAAYPALRASAVEPAIAVRSD